MKRCRICGHLWEIFFRGHWIEADWITPYYRERWTTALCDKELER